MIEYDEATTRQNDLETERVPHPSLAAGLTHQQSQRPLVASSNPRAANRSTSTRCSTSPHMARPLWTPEDNDSFPPLTHFDDFDVALAEGITA